MIKEYPVIPFAKPRMTQRDKWKHRPIVDAYMAFKDECRLHKVTINPCGDHITFVVPMPKAWSKTRQLVSDGIAHQQRPDVDNYFKAILDAIFGDDSHVWDCRITKVWGREGKIIIQSKEG